MTPFLIDHLWQSTWFALPVGMIALLLRKNSARIRYWLWLAASVKFLIPFALLSLIGSSLPLGNLQNIELVILDRWLAISIEPAASLAANGDPDLPAAAQADAGVAAMMAAPTSPGRGEGKSVLRLLSFALLVVWLSGTAVVLGTWVLRWRELRRIVTESQAFGAHPHLLFPIPVLESATTIEPGIVGILKPALLLPRGIGEHLNVAQLQAIFAHELTHLMRRDNLTASLHMLVEAVFWFHPLVWWIGARLINERERACDETAVKLTAMPEVYAEGILCVCKYYVEPPLRSVPAISGGNLRQRVERIIARLDPEVLSMKKKFVLVTFALVAIVGPILFGGLEPAGAQVAPRPGSVAAPIVYSVPDGWSAFPGGGPDSLPGRCVIGVDEPMRLAGTENLTIKCDKPESSYGGIYQSFDADEFRGKRIRYSAMMRTENVIGDGVAEGVATLWMRMERSGIQTDRQPPVTIARLGERALSGTMGWTPVDIVTDISSDTWRIHIGFILQTRGQMWITGMKFEEALPGLEVNVVQVEPAVITADQPTTPQNLFLE